MAGLFGGSSPELVKKWNLSSFVAEDSPRIQTGTSIASGLPEIKLSDLNKNIKQINLNMSKLSMEYDKLFRKFGFKSADLKKYIKVLLERDDIGETLSALENSDINILINQMRIIENKSKLESERFKQIRDEKKLQLDILKASGAAVDNSGTQVNVQQNSPIAVASMAGRNIAPGTIDLGAISNIPVIEHQSTTANIQVPTENPKEKETVEAVSNEPIPANFVSNSLQYEANKLDKGADGSNPTSPAKSTLDAMKSIVVASDNFDGSTTMADIHKNSVDIMIERMKNKDSMLSHNTNLLGHNLNTSLAGLKMKKTPHTRILYVNVDDGTFYEKGFYLNQDGSIGPELPPDNFIPRSVTHLGELEFDTINREVTTYYEDTPIPYRLVTTSSGMGEFYNNEWNDNKTNKYRIPEDVLVVLRAQVNA